MCSMLQTKIEYGLSVWHHSLTALVTFASYDIRRKFGRCFKFLNNVVSKPYVLMARDYYVLW